jgi:hypothetical protein
MVDKNPFDYNWLEDLPFFFLWTSKTGMGVALSGVP